VPLSAGAVEQDACLRSPQPETSTAADTAKVCAQATALHLAAANGHAETVSVLLDHGAAGCGANRSVLGGAVQSSLRIRRPVQRFTRQSNVLPLRPTLIAAFHYSS